MRIVESSQLVGPGAGGIHHNAGANARGLARQDVAHDRTAHASVGLEQRRRLDVVGRERAGTDSAAHGRDDETRVVGLSVVVQGRADQAAVSQPWFDASHFLGAEPAMPTHVAECRQQIVEPHSGAQLPCGNTAAPIHGKEECERPHQMRRDLEKHASFAARFEDQVERALLEIANATVDEARRV